jgi:hypothetical protein
VIVGEVSGQDPAQVPFAKDDDMIETLAPDRADEPLREGVLPRAVRCREDFLDPHALHSVAKTNGALTIAATGVTFADEANVPSYPGYGRTLRIISCATGCVGITDANLRMVTVNVTYTPLTGPSKTTSMTKLTSRR